MHFITFLWKNLQRRTIRSALTASGVAIAVGAAVALLSVAEGFETSMAQSFSNKGTHIIVTSEGLINQLNSDLDQRIADQIRGVAGVKEVAPGLLEMLSYQVRGEAVPLLVQGWPLNSFLMDTLKLTGGQGLTGRKQVLLGAKLAQNLGKQVGDTIVLERQKFTIVGVFESTSFYDNGGVVMSLPDMQEMLVREGTVTGFSVIVDRADQDEKYISQVAERINALTNDEGLALGIAAMSTQEYAENAVLIRMAQSMAWVTSLIAVVVGAIGTLNTMVMSVVERIREIAILRAIGWRKSRVVAMIVGESLILSVLGAVVGIVAAFLFLKWLANNPAASNFVEGKFPPTVVLRGFLLALLVGLIGGLYPAYRATRMLPSEGMRHE